MKFTPYKLACVGAVAGVLAPAFHGDLLQFLSIGACAFAANVALVWEFQRHKATAEALDAARRDIRDAYYEGFEDGAEDTLFVSSGSPSGKSNDPTGVGASWIGSHAAGHADGFTLTLKAQEDAQVDCIGRALIPQYWDTGGHLTCSQDRSGWWADIRRGLRNAKDQM